MGDGMDSRNRDIGRRVSYWRSRRGLSRQQFADLVGRSMSWVDKGETSQRGRVRLPMLEAVATALQVDIAAITDDEVARAAARGPDAVEVRAIRAALGSYQAIIGGGEPVDLTQLQSQVDYSCSAGRSAHFSTIGRILPKLIIEAQTAADRLTGPCRLAATRCLVMVYRLASASFRLCMLNSLRRGPPSDTVASSNTCAIASMHGDAQALVERSLGQDRP